MTTPYTEGYDNALRVGRHDDASIVVKRERIGDVVEFRGECRDREKSPMNEDPQFGIVEPIGKRVLA